MSLFDSIIAASSIQAPKGIIYGPPGVGKTTFGASASGSIIIDCENGAGTIACRRTPYLKTWPEIHAWLKELATGKHDYQTVVVDTVDWLLRRIEEHVSGCAGDAAATLNRSHGGYGNGKQVMKNYVYQTLLPLLDTIVARRVVVVLLAHAARTELTNADGITTEKTAPDIVPDYLNPLVEWSDFVGLAHRKANGSRVMVTQETPQAVAKNRYNLPPELPLVWPEFMAAIKAGTAHLFTHADTKHEEM